jgi:dihydroorotase
VSDGAVSARYGSLADAPASFVLRGVRIVDPDAGTTAMRDLSVVDGVLRDELAPFDVPRIDAAGLVAAPGLCDLHAHFRTPGDESSETLESGARAAAHGGFTTVCVMPNTDPALDDPWLLRGLTAAVESIPARVRFIAAATRGRAGADLSDHGALADAGAVAVSDDGAAIPSAAVARRALAYLRPLGLPLVEHAEDAGLASGSVMRASGTATRLGLGGWPASAEATIVERDLALAAETDGWVHFTHVSTAAALGPIRRARAAGVRVTADVAPHHLALTDAWVAGDRRFAWEADLDDEPRLDPATAYDGACRVNPPLPTREDAAALMTALRDGTIDAVATDHAPHPPERKAVPFAEAAPGMIGLETALGIGLLAVEAGQIDLATMLAALSTRPARLIGETRSLADGATADLVVFDPTRSWPVGPGTLVGRSTNTPLLGRTLPGVVRLTVAGGRVTYDDGLVGPATTTIRIEAR